MKKILLIFLLIPVFALGQIKFAKKVVYIAPAFTDINTQWETDGGVLEGTIIRTGNNLTGTGKGVAGLKLMPNVIGALEFTFDSYQMGVHSVQTNSFGQTALMYSIVRNSGDTGYSIEYIDTGGGSHFDYIDIGTSVIQKVTIEFSATTVSWFYGTSKTLLFSTARDNTKTLYPACEVITTGIGNIKQTGFVTTP